MNAEPIKRVLVIIAIAAKAFHDCSAHGMHENFVGVRGQIIGALIIVTSPCHYLLPARLEALKGCRHFAQCCQAAAVEVVKHQHDAINF